MEFVTPLMLLGLVAIAIPIAVHLFGKQRAKVIRFAAVDFLLGSDERVARRLKLRDFLLLLLRVLVCLALPLALSKPFTSCESKGPAVAGGSQAAVIIIDNSISSGYELGDETLLRRSIDRGRRIIEQLSADSEVALVLAAEGSPPPAELSADHLKVQAEIAKLRPSSRIADTTTALRRAAELLTASPRETRRIFLLTPLVKGGFRVGEAPWPAEAAPDLTVIDITDGEALPNLAVTKVSVVRDADSGSRGVRVTAEISNFGSEPAPNIGAQLLIGERVVARGSVTIGANATAEKVFTGSLPKGARSAGVTVAISGDPLDADNQRHAIGELRDQVRTLLVNGDPRAARHNDELFYLEAALRPGDRDESGIVVTRTTVDQLALPSFPAKLEQIDVIVLANCAALSTEVSDRIADWVERGGGLWISLGSNVEAADYNERMSKLLPGTLRSLVDTSFGRTGAERTGSAVSLSKLEQDHPLFSSFSADAPGLRDAKFSRFYLLGTTTDVEKRRVLARYESGAASMLEATRGNGRLLLYTSTLDRDWNDLPIQPGFLPLVQQAVRYLGRKPTDLRRRDGLVGGLRLLSVPADVERIEVTRPDGGRTTIDTERLGRLNKVGKSSGGSATFEDTDEPGFYKVAIVRAGADALEAAVSEDFALNIATEASDLSRLDPANLPKGAGGQSAVLANASHKRRVELWHVFAALLLGFLLFESVLALRS